MMQSSDERSRLKSLLVPALFWSVFGYYTFGFLIFRVLVPVHQVIEPTTAKWVWAFYLEENHPARMVSVGFIELLVGWLCFEHFRRNGVAGSVLQMGRHSKAAIVWTIIGALILPDVFQNLVYEAYIWIGGAAPEAYKDGQDTMFEARHLLAFSVAAVFIAPVIEEFLFRGALVTTALASGWSVPLVVIVSSVGFTFIHGQYTPYGMIAIFGFGVALASLRIWSGGLVLPMVAHAVYNLKVMLFAVALATQG